MCAPTHTWVLVRYERLVVFGVVELHQTPQIPDMVHISSEFYGVGVTFRPHSLVARWPTPLGDCACVNHKR